MVAKLILLGAWLGAAWSQAPGTKLLTADELKALLSKTTVIQFTRGSAKGTGVLALDGKARLDGGSWSANGSWRIQDNKYCSKYPGIRRGYETCYTVEKTGQNTYTLYDTEDGTKGTWVVEQ